MWVRLPPSLPFLSVITGMSWITLLFAGRSGKPCLTKLISYQWITFIMVVIGYCVWKNGSWPENIPTEVYLTIPMVLGVKTYGDIKLKSLAPPQK